MGLLGSDRTSFAGLLKHSSIMPSADVKLISMFVAIPSVNKK
jgi:hypothetical protein